MTESYEVPEPDEVNAEWWEATREHRLLLQRCDDCGHRQHPPRALCTGCGTMEGLGWEELDGTGRIDVTTVVHVAPLPGLTAPYTVGRVTVAAGVRMLTGIEVEPPVDLEPGTQVTLTWRDLPDGRALPMFRPAGSAASPMSPTSLTSLTSPTEGRA